MLQIQQMPLPESREALLWIIAGVLCTVIVYLYRELRKSDDRVLDVQNEIIEKNLSALSELNSVVSNLADTMEQYQEQLAIRQELESLRSEIRNAAKKD